MEYFLGFFTFVWILQSTQAMRQIPDDFYKHLNKFSSLMPAFE